jgi:hypothetical protein
MPSKPFDATLKELIEVDASAWLAFAGLAHCQSFTFVDADLSTVSAAADKVLRVEEAAGPSLLNLELEARHAADAPGRLHLYSTLLQHRHGLPVRSVLLLLRREANASAVTGTLVQHLPGDPVPYDVFRYRVIRLWDVPVADLLKGGLGTLPLAPLTDEAVVDLTAVVGQVEQRFRSEASAAEADKLRAATFVLLGLRYEPAVIEKLFQGVTSMEESSTYQWLISRGEKRALLLQGRKKFGQPDEAVQATLDKLTDRAVLDQLCERILDVASWQELLAGLPG